jgi:hypothetical protein
MGMGRRSVRSESLAEELEEEEEEHDDRVKIA